LSRKIKTQTRVFLISVYFPVPLLQTWQTTQGLQGDLSILLPWIFFYPSALADRRSPVLREALAADLGNKKQQRGWD